jgi:hypothetical protein
MEAMTTATMQPPAHLVKKDAVIRGENREYRYQLTRVWDQSLPYCVWVMLNPSTADADSDDATIRKCMGFAMSWNYGGITVVNLFAWRSRSPKALITAGIDPIGPENDHYITLAVRGAARVVCGWGATPFAVTRAPAVTARIWRHSPRPPMCLGMTKAGEPKHPLTLGYATELVTFGSRS